MDLSGSFVLCFFLFFLVCCVCCMFSWSNLSDAFLLHVPTVFFFRMHHHRLFRSVCYRNRIQQLRCIKRHIGTSYFEARPEPGIRESPLPLFFVRGSEEYDWSKVINDFSAKGYGGVVVDLPPLVETVDDAVDYLENVKTKHGLVPPIMITFGLTTFVGQKYLESYSLRGLIMVNPIPPHNYEAALRRLDQSHAHKLVESLLAKKQNVLLEPGAVRMLLIQSTYPSFTVTEEDMVITSKYHAIDAESVKTASSATELFRIIHGWIEDVL